MSYDMGFGVVHFDDVNAHSSGYYARAGQKARRLSGNHCGDLATDVVWLTNLNYETMRSAHVYPHAKYRRNDFLGETFKNLLARLGFFDMKDAVTCQDGVERVALLFEHVMQHAQVYGGFDTVPPTEKKYLILKLLPIRACASFGNQWNGIATGIAK